MLLLRDVGQKDPRYGLSCKGSLRLVFLLVGFTLTTPIVASIPATLENASPQPELSLPPPQPFDEPVNKIDKIDGKWPEVLVRSFVRVGNRGEEELDVKIPKVCGEPIWVFDRAEINVLNNRFGAAQFVRLPRPGCVADCSPIVVRWYHEPTGHLVFGVKVFRRQTTLECTNPARREEVDS